MSEHFARMAAAAGTCGHDAVSRRADGAHAPSPHTPARVRGTFPGVRDGIDALQGTAPRLPIKPLTWPAGANIF